METIQKAQGQLAAGDSSADSARQLIDGASAILAIALDAEVRRLSNLFNNRSGCIWSDIFIII